MAREYFKCPRCHKGIVGTHSITRHQANMSKAADDPTLCINIRLQRQAQKATTMGLALQLLTTLQLQTTMQLLTTIQLQTTIQLWTTLQLQRTMQLILLCLSLYSQLISWILLAVAAYHSCLISGKLVHALCETATVLSRRTQ